MDETALRKGRSPLPLLSDAMLSSGLINDPSVFVPRPQENQQAIWGTTTKKSVKRAQSKQSRLSEIKPKKETKVKTEWNPPVLSPVEIGSYKPQPIENLSEAPTRSKLPTERGPLSFLSDGRRSGFRSQIERIAQQLDAGSEEIEREDLDENDKREKLVQLHNYCFNELILSEKESFSEKALLLRRFQQFYNHELELKLGEVPRTPQLESQVSQDLSAELAELKKQIEQDKVLSRQSRSQEDVLRKELEQLRSRMQQQESVITEKTVELQLMKEDKDLQQTVKTQLEFKIDQKDKEIQRLNKAISERDEENSRQLKAIEENSRIINQLQTGEAGYIATYHQEKVKREEAEAKIKELEQRIYNITHIPKTDQCVDTTDLPRPVTSKKRRKAEDPQTFISSSKTQGCLGNEVTVADKVSRTTVSVQTVQIEPILPVITDVSVQTDPLQSVKLEEPKNVVEEKLSEEEKVEKGVLAIKYQTPEGYDIDHKNIDELPNLVAAVVPLLSQSFHVLADHELNILNIGLYPSITPHQKPITWALQLIHGFLTDPFLRSSQNQSKSSLETIFVDWLTTKYKVQHLVNQIVVDFSYTMMRYREQDKMLKFFQHILENRFTIAQVCFAATLYSFSVPFTYPSFLNMIQLSDMSPNASGYVEIHIVAAFKVLAKCLSTSVAEEILTPKADPLNPMLDYVEFLILATNFFGGRHELVFSQVKDLLALLGCHDMTYITYDQYRAFFSFLGGDTDLKQRWRILLTQQEHPCNAISFSEIITCCAEQKKPFMTLIGFRNLAPSVQRLKEMSSIVFGLHDDIVTRYCHLVSSVLPKVPAGIVGSLSKSLERLRTAVLSTDVREIMMNYKLFLLRLDKVCLRYKGVFPFPPSPTPGQVDGLIDYIKRAESIAFTYIN